MPEHFTKELKADTFGKKLQKSQIFSLLLAMFFPIKVVIRSVKLLKEFVMMLTCFAEDQFLLRYRVSVMVWISSILLIAYGAIKGFQVQGYDVNTFDLNGADGYIIYARIFGKTITVFHFMFIIFVFRPVIVSIDSTPLERKSGMSWRTYHTEFAKIAFIASIVHGIFHVLRRHDTKHPHESYEVWELATGIALFGVFILQYMPHNCLKGSHKKYKTFWKRFFRRYHYKMFIFFEIVLVVHSYTAYPLILIVLLQTSYHYSKLSYKKIKIRFKKGKIPVDSTSKEFDVCELGVEFENAIPQLFGYSCILQVGSVSAMYTLIPVDSHRGIFRIAECTLTRELLSLYKKKISRCPEDFIKNQQFTHEINIGIMQIYGPFRTSDYSLANIDNVLCLVKGVGDTVPNSIISYNLFRQVKSIKVIVLKIETDKTKHDSLIFATGGPEMTIDDKFGLRTDIIEDKLVNKPKHLGVSARDVLIHNFEKKQEKQKKNEDEQKQVLLDHTDAKTYGSHGTHTTGRDTDIDISVNNSSGVDNTWLTGRCDKEIKVKGIYNFLNYLLHLKQQMIFCTIPTLKDEYTIDMIKQLQSKKFDVIICSRQWAKTINKNISDINKFLLHNLIIIIMINKCTVKTQNGETKFPNPSVTTIYCSTVFRTQTTGT